MVFPLLRKEMENILSENCSILFFAIKVTLKYFGVHIFIFIPVLMKMKYLDR